MQYRLLFSILLLFIFLYFTKNECILGEKATESIDCLKKRVNGTFCCFLTPLENKNLDSICYPYSIEKYIGYRHINYNRNTYEIECGLGSTFMDSTWELTIENRKICGSENPKDEKDCFAGSTKINSCCYYEGHGLKSCYWLGKKYRSVTKNNGWSFSCGETFIQMHYIFLFYILISIL